MSPQVAGGTLPAGSPALSFCICEEAGWNLGLEIPGDRASYAVFPRSGQWQGGHVEWGDA